MLWNGFFLKDGEAGIYNGACPSNTHLEKSKTALQLKLSFYSLATVTQVTQLQYSPYYCLL